MTDELTPEEREALKKLPRERMPSAGLEARVVGALRERGVLSKRRRRMIEITNSRVAGLVAACVALVIGAYAVGLQRGGTSQLPGMSAVEPRRSDRAYERQPAGRNERQPAEEQKGVSGGDGGDLERQATPASDTPVQRERAADKLATPSAPTTTGKDDLASSKEKEEDRAQNRPSPSTLADEQKTPKRVGAVAEDEGLAETTTSPSKTQKATGEVPSPQAMMMEKRAGAAEPEGVATLAQPIPTGERPLSFPHTFSFLLNGTPVVIDAPDSVRVTRDDLGQTIIIYTRDGPIRIRVADDR